VLELDINQPRSHVGGGFKTEFEYAVFGGEVRDVKSSFSRVFQRLWETNRDEVLDYSERHGGPIFETNEVNRRFEALQGSDYLFMGLYPHWMLAEIQGILAWSRSMPIRRGRRSSLWWQRAPRAQVVRRRGWIDHTESLQQPAKAALRPPWCS
jgi:hypothetical protein